MKKYLLLIFFFLFAIFIPNLSIAQGKGNGGGGNNGGNNNGGNKYEIVGNQKPCVGAIETYKITPNPGNNAIEWNWDGPRANANEVEWQVISTSPDKSQITFRVGDKPGTVRAKPEPGSNNTENLPVHPGEGIQVVLEGPNAVCANVQQVYKVVIKNLGKGKKDGKDISAEDLKITWVLPTGLAVVSGQNTGTLTVMPSASFNGGNLKVSVAVPAEADTEPSNNGNGVGGFTGFCGGAVDANMQVGVGNNCAPLCPVSTVIIAGPASVCAEQEELVTYTANVTNGTANMEFAWTVPTGWVITGGAETNSIKVRVGTTTGEVSVRATNNCSATAATATKIIAFGNNCGNTTAECSMPMVVINGPTEVCANQVELAKYTAAVSNSTGALTYNWSVPTGWVIKNGLGTNAIEVQVGSAAGTVGLNVTNDCGNQAGTMRNIALSTNCGGTTTPPECTAPTVTVSGPANLCAFADEPVTYKANVTNGTSDLTYVWSISNTAEGFEILSEEGDSFVFRVGYSEEPVSISVTVKNSCGEATNGLVATVNLECGEVIPQPVELLSFTGESTKDGVLLQWSTATEKNNDRFELERSTDGQTFAKVGQVKGQGNSTTKRIYSMRDNRASQGTYYYRLKQVDYNGEFEYSKMVSVNHKFGLALAAEMVIAPNPVSSGQFTLSLPQAATNAQVQLLDLNGRVLYTQKLAAGSNEATFSTQSLNIRPGMYLIKLQDGDQLSQSRLIVK